MKAKTGTLVVPFLFILALDQATKIWIDGHLRIYERIPLLTDRLYMTYLRNPGAAFGIFRGWPASIRIPFFVAVSALAVGCIGYFFYRARRDQWVFVSSLGFLLGGILGNLIDRVRLGEVIDFIDIQWGTFRWAPFNVADTGICLGVALLGIHMFFLDKPPPEPAEPAEPIEPPV